ncbi:MAG: M48 family metalloprotease [Oligoflexia bacterium]|nr:M48 family metalloprotease [Oligoflexia bacterium]
MHTPSLTSRALLAVALFLGFYLLALAMAGTLLALPLAEVEFAGRLHIKLAILCVVAALLILWSILPRFDRFEAPGPRLLPQQHPALFAVLEEVAAQTAQAMPREVYLVSGVNAFVSQRGGIMGLGSRRVMGLGLPLMQVLDVAQLRAVIAHEFGHFHGGDTALGPWVYKTRAALGRTVSNLGKTRHALIGLVQKPFLAYQRLFLRLTLSVSRAQEIAADRLAARTQGAAPLAQGLSVVYGAGLAYDGYFRNEILPALDAGYRPPYARGFAIFLQQPALRKVIDDALTQALESGETDSMDTHPALRDRLAALAELPAGESQDERPATELLSDLDLVEHQLLANLFVDSDRGQSLKPVSWQAVGQAVYAPIWHERAWTHAAVLSGITPLTMPTDTAGLISLARQALGDDADSVYDEELQGFAQTLLGSALATVLTQQGWIVRTPPGCPVTCYSSEQPDAWEIEPINLPIRLCSGKLLRSDWVELVTSAGLEKLDLGEIEPPPSERSTGAASQRGT